MKDTATLVGELTLLEKAALLSGANTWQTREIPRLDVPAVSMSDGPHGVRKQVGSADHLGLNGSEPATCFPTAATLAGSWDESLAHDVGVALGAEAAAQGVGVLLGPGLNIKRSPLGGRSFEYFSEDPELSGRLAAALVRGIQSQGVAATPKHFAVNSQERHRMVNDSVLDERTLREIYLTAFEIVVRESAPWALMSSYNLVNGAYAHENARLLTEILRDEWGFDGAVISDWGGGNDAVAAVAAGGTIEMPSPGFESARAIVAAVESGELDVRDLDARVSEIIELVRRVSREKVAVAVDVDRHHALARRAAAQSMIVLRNEDALLPLAAATRVALIGDFAQNPRFQGAGSSLVNATRVPTLVDAVGDSSLELVGVAAGFDRDGRADADLFDAAVGLAADADVAIVMIGLPESAESEGLDRSTLALPDVQIRLLEAVCAANPRTVAVLSAGGVVEMPWRTAPSALIHAYLGGQAAAEALVDVVTGAVNPSGRLAETMPLRLEDTPTAGRFPSEQRTTEYREGPFVGYRYYETADVDVAYPFGFGLSYTTFVYSELEVTDAGIRATITNTGERDGSEVVQLYVGRADVSAVPRAARELKGFARVTVAAGQSSRVSIPFTDRTFRFFDAGAGSWQVEAGSYRIEVGSSVRDLPLRAVLTVDGSVDAGTPDARLSSYAVAAIASVTDAEFERMLGRPVPVSAWPRGPLGANDPMDRLREAPGALARGLFRLLDRRRRRTEARGVPDLNILFLFNGPFRVISKMSDIATGEVTDAILMIVNGRVLRGVGHAMTAFVRGRRAEKATARAFDSAADPRRTQR